MLRTNSSSTRSDKWFTTSLNDDLTDTDDDLEWKSGIGHSGSGAKKKSKGKTKREGKLEGSEWLLSSQGSGA